MRKWPFVLATLILAVSPAIAAEGCTQVFGAPRSSFVAADHPVTVLPGPVDWKQIRKVDNAFRKASPSGPPSYHCGVDGCVISTSFKGDESSLTFSKAAHEFLLVCTIKLEPCSSCESTKRPAPLVQIMWESGTVSYGIIYTDNKDYWMDADLPVDPDHEFLNASRKLSSLVRLDINTRFLAH